MRRLLSCWLLTATFVAGCAQLPPTSSPAAPGDLALDGRAWVAGDTLRADLRVTNTSSYAVSLGFGACSARLTGRLEADDAAPPLDTRIARTADGERLVCPSSLGLATLAPGASLGAGEGRRELRIAVPLADVMTDSVRDGRYALTATFVVSPVTVGAAAFTLRADLPAVEVAWPRPPLGRETTRLGARFTADSVRVDGDTLRAVVHAWPIPYQGTDVVGWAPCAVRVLAFADAPRRDAAPRAGAPDATADAACGQPPPVPFRAADAATGAPAFYLATDRPLRAVVALPLTGWLAGRPAGTYALAVAVRTLGPAGHALRELTPAWLSLGAVDWRP